MFEEINEFSCWGRLIRCALESPKSRGAYMYDHHTTMCASLMCALAKPAWYRSRILQCILGMRCERFNCGAPAPGKCHGGRQHGRAVVPLCTPICAVVRDDKPFLYFSRSEGITEGSWHWLRGTAYRRTHADAMVKFTETGEKKVGLFGLFYLIVHSAKH